MLRWSLFTIVFIFALFGMATAATIHVPGQQSTIQGALYLAANGDTILVAAGTYSEHITFLGKNVLVKSQDGPEESILQAAAAYQPIVRFQSGEPSSATLEGFTVRNALDTMAVIVTNSSATLKGNIFINNTRALDGGAVSAVDGPVLYILDNTFQSNSCANVGGAIRAYGTRLVCSGNMFYDNRALHDAGAIHLRANDNSVVDHNLFVGNSCSDVGGAIVFSQCHGGEFCNNTVSENSSDAVGGGAGLVVWVSSDINIYNNIIVNNIGAGISRGPFTSNCPATYNDVWGNIVDYDSIPPGIGSISIDPLFVDGHPHSYYLSDYSPCIDIGDPASPLDPNGTRADMGAFYNDYNGEAGSVAGIVLDSLLNPIEGAVVTALFTSRLDTTDDTGYFIINRLRSSSTYDIRIHHSGYVDSILPDIFVDYLDTTSVGSIILEWDQNGEYVLGDLNGDGDATPLADVVYGYNYLRGGSAPANIFCTDRYVRAAADIDADCNFDQDDMWYLTRYLMRQSTTHFPCPDCAQPIPDPLLEPSGTDPGAPDTVFLGYPDGTTVKASLEYGAIIPIWIKNDEAIGGAHIPFAADTADFFYLGGGISYHPLFSRWPMSGFLDQESNQPAPGYISASFLGWRGHATDIPCLNSNGAYQLVAHFGTSYIPDMGRVGDTIQIFAGRHSRVGGPAFSDSAGLNEWIPVVMPAQVEVVAGPPAISVSPSPITAYVDTNSTASVNLYITASGQSDLYFQIGPYDFWMSFDHIERVVPASRTDTVVVTFNSTGLPPGLNIGQITIGSNAPDSNGYTYVPVNLTVGGGGVGCDYTPGDINGVSGVNGIDVIYGVNYFKGGPAPATDCDGICPEASPFYAAGDVNGNCQFNGIDITYFVSFLKGAYSSLLYCPTCPPAEDMVAPGPVTPTLQPVARPLKSKVTSSR